MISTLLLAAAALHAVPPPPLAPQNASANTTSANTAEDVEVLRTLLVDSLNDSFEERKPKRDEDAVTLSHSFGDRPNLVTELWAAPQTVQHSRAFHMPDVGVFFSLDASLPVIAKDEDQKEPESDQPTDDEWEAARREVRGSVEQNGALFRRLHLVTPVAGEIDPQAIDKLVDVALRTLARHASRVEGLSPRETITLAIRLGGRSRTLFQSYTVPGERVEVGHEPETELENDQAYSTSAYVFAAGQNVREQHLVVRVAVSDLTAEGGFDRLRQRAQINRY